MLHRLEQEFFHHQNRGGNPDAHPSAQNRKFLHPSQRHKHKNRGPHHRFQSTDCLPSSVDLRDQCPEVYDQGQLGSCTANALAAAYQFDEMKRGESVVGNPSRLFIYYNERATEGDTDKDAGACTADGITGLQNVGVVSESDWPYDISEFATKPSDDLYSNAQSNVATSFKQVSQQEDQIKQALNQGYPVLFTADIYASFESSDVGSSGQIPMPQEGEKSMGSHAIIIVGYNDDNQQFIVRNSWGADWGDQGYCYFPYAYVTDETYTSQFWVLFGVSD